MSNITFTWSNLDAGFCWKGPQDYMDTIFGLLSGTMPGGAGVYISDSLPPVDNQGDVWVRTVGGLLEGVYLYQGFWHRPNPVTPSSSQIMIWKGTEADLWSHDGGDGTDPGTTAPTDFTGAMWMVDTDFDFRFPIGAGTNTGNVYPPAVAATTLAVGDTGGVEKHTLVTNETPIHTHNMFTDEYVSNPGPPAGNESVAVKADVGASTDKEYWLQKGTVDPTLGITGEIGADLAHENMPPFKCVYFCKRTSRKFITVLV